MSPRRFVVNAYRSFPHIRGSIYAHAHKGQKFITVASIALVFSKLEPTD
nr:MAG TPA: hypothetical protein [Caudoviricetes sp.]